MKVGAQIMGGGDRANERNPENTIIGGNRGLPIEGPTITGGSRMVDLTQNGQVISATNRGSK